MQQGLREHRCSFRQSRCVLKNARAIGWSSRAKSTLPSSASLIVPASAMFSFSVCQVSRALLPFRLVLSRVRRLFDFVGRPWPVERVLQLRQRISAYSAALATDHDKPERPVELRQLCLGDIPRELFRKTKPRDTGERAVLIFDIVFDVDFAVANDGGFGKIGISIPHLPRNDFIWIQNKAAIPEIGHR